MADMIIVAGRAVWLITSSFAPLIQNLFCAPLVCRWRQWLPLCDASWWKRRCCCCGLMTSERDLSYAAAAAAAAALAGARFHAAVSRARSPAPPRCCCCREGRFPRQRWHRLTPMAADDVSELGGCVVLLAGALLVSSQRWRRCDVPHRCSTVDITLPAPSISFTVSLPVGLYRRENCSL